MASLNRVTLIGYLGRDPEVHHAEDGTAICNVSIATSHKGPDRRRGSRSGG
ncbi:single-stranded DNA-binding protein [Achromobacter xylosoxidans]|uniref:single-stranded DNA-binding protein n=1 Tax=Alcaligenes xylosoxydans xylosoxydans TaxID=85698 RepID=UPI0009F3AA86